MKILELTNYSSGICGVFSRVKQEAVLLGKNHDVWIFTSDAIKGSDSVEKNKEEKIGNVLIKRFPFAKIGGESFMRWDFEKQALALKPDVIIAHSYRHPHTTKALSISKKLNKKGHKCKVFLVTHAPFIDSNQKRSLISGISVKLYDRFISRLTLKKFDKILSIAKWEIPFLLKMGLEPSKIEYLPNGIPDKIFYKPKKKGKGIFFLGRISPVKNLGLLLKSAKELNLEIDIIGPAEKTYLKNLKEMIDEKNKKIKFLPPIYDLDEKTKTIDKYEIFVLPSLSEAMPQSLIEVMARGKIVLSSDTKGGSEIIHESKNGFLFKNNDLKSLNEKLNLILNMNESEKSKIRKNAITSSEKYKWSFIIKKLENIITSKN